MPENGFTSCYDRRDSRQTFDPGFSGDPQPRVEMTWPGDTSAHSVKWTFCLQNGENRVEGAERPASDVRLECDFETPQRWGKPSPPELPNFKTV